MRRNSPFSSFNLHFHNGSTCHGTTTLKEAIEYALSLKENCSILEQTDKLAYTKQIVKCYSVIRKFAEEHWKQHGKFVTKIRYKAVITGKKK